MLQKLPNECATSTHLWTLSNKFFSHILKTSINQTDDRTSKLVTLTKKVLVKSVKQSIKRQNTKQLSFLRDPLWWFSGKNSTSFCSYITASCLVHRMHTCDRPHTWKWEFESVELSSLLDSAHSHFSSASSEGPARSYTILNDFQALPSFSSPAVCGAVV